MFSLYTENIRYEFGIRIMVINCAGSGVVHDTIICESANAAPPLCNRKCQRSQCVVVGHRSSCMSVCVLSMCSASIEWGILSLASATQTHTELASICQSFTIKHICTADTVQIIKRSMCDGHVGMCVCVFVRRHACDCRC